MDTKFKKIATEAVKESGKILLDEYEIFDRNNVMMKSKHEIVTKLDLLSEEIIIKKIIINFPTHGIVSEERGEIKGVADYVWYIDPIDGTPNFSIHNPLWSMSLALAYENNIMLGVVYAPVLGELFVAEAGGGAWLNNRKLAVSEINQGKTINTFCHGAQNKDIKKALSYCRQQKLNGFDCRQLGSAAIELAYVAAGRVESIFIPGAHSWDIAAGVLLVNEAGGKVTDINGRPWHLQSDSVIASNGKVHRQILAAVD
jgi:myo-inositol-1(or 4)-monophosphatase